jgi:hypothetical protein
MHVRNEKCRLYNILAGKSKRKDHMEDFGVAGMIILRTIFKK